MKTRYSGETGMGIERRVVGPRWRKVRIPCVHPRRWVGGWRCSSKKQKWTMVCGWLEQLVQKGWDHSRVDPGAGYILERLKLAISPNSVAPFSRSVFLFFCLSVFLSCCLAVFLSFCFSRWPRVVVGFSGIQSFRVRFGYISGAVRLVLGLKRGSVAVVTQQRFRNPRGHALAPNRNNVDRLLFCQLSLRS